MSDDPFEAAEGEEIVNEYLVAGDALLEDIRAKVSSCMDIADSMEDRLEGNRRRIKELMTINRSLEAGSKRLRSYAYRCAKAAHDDGSTTFQAERHVLRATTSKALELDEAFDLTQLGDQFLITKTSQQVDKTALKKALIAGEIRVDGATVVSRVSITAKGG